MPNNAFNYTTALLDEFVFSPGTPAAAGECLAQDASAIFHTILRDQEAEPALYAAKQIVDARLAGSIDCWDVAVMGAATTEAGYDPAGLMGFLAARGDELSARVREAVSGEQRVRRAVLRERAAIALVANCWADTVSQPATQPGGSVNILFGQHFVWLGEGEPANSIPELRTRLMNEAGLVLPGIIDRSFTEKAAPTTSTALSATYLVSLSRYPANYYPETLGTHLAYHALGLDTALFGVASPIAPADLTTLIDAYIQEIRSRSDGRLLMDRLLHAVAVMVQIETRQADLLEELAHKTARQNLDSRVAELVQRHAPMAGAHHRRVRVGGQAMSETFAAADVDLQAFMQNFRQSSYLRQSKDGSCAFTRSVKFGGPMFGIFSAEEARTFADWAREVAENPTAPVVLCDARPADAEGAAELERLRAFAPRNIVLDDSPPANDRELFYRLVNIENHPASLAVARSRAESGLAAARLLFACGTEGRFTDGSFFAYTPQALLDRVDQIYWTKLVGPYKPLAAIPGREDVISEQKTVALGNLIDGSWSYRIANTGRYDRVADGKLFLIHADEMGLGDLRKNHITLIYDVFDSMDVHLPHISDTAFLTQTELPDEIYDFAINQLSLALFPDSYYPEIVGYNLAIEMFGLGELRMHAIQKLKHHGLNAIYEEAHLSIDNASSGHARQSAEIVNDHLDDVRRRFGEQLMQQEWRRVWNGYCSFAQFVEIGHIDFEAERAAQTPAELAQPDLAVTTI